MSSDAVDADPRPLSVGISTRDRPESLARCVKSLALLGDLVREVIVVDDCSAVPLEAALRRSLGADFPLPVRVVRQQSNEGYIVARNLIVKAARGEFVLNLDDDAFVLDAGAVRRALELMGCDERVGVVAFAQAEATGEPWPVGMQPSPAKYPCYIPSFIGFAHLLRREVFLSLGGYRDSFFFYGEEKEYCLRLLDAGLHVVYLPEALVAHVPDPAGRSGQKYLRYTVRNNCLGALYNEPLPMLLLSLPLRLALYFRMRRGWKIEDPGGFSWVIRQVLSAMPSVWRARSPLKWATFRRWRALRQQWPPYPVGSPGGKAPGL